MKQSPETKFYSKLTKKKFYMDISLISVTFLNFASSSLESPCGARGLKYCGTHLVIMNHWCWCYQCNQLYANDFDENEWWWMLPRTQYRHKFCRRACGTFVLFHSLPAIVLVIINIAIIVAVIIMQHYDCKKRKNPGCW